MTTDVAVLTALYNDLGVATTASYDLEPVTESERAAWLADHEAHNWPVLVAEAAGQVVGFAAYSRFRDKPGYGMTVEHSIYVAEPAQRLGAGRALMDALLARARAAGVHAMVGVIDADNAASVTFHEHLRFRNEGVLHEVGRKFGRWLNVAFLVLLLDEPQPEV